MIVFDASLAVKWYLLEPNTLPALALLKEHGGAIVVPDIFIAEVTGALVRQANIDKSLRASSEESIGRFAALFENGLVSVHHMGTNRIATAAHVALNLGHPLKDCIYLALAMELGCPLVTADARFAARARDVYGDVRVLGE